MSFVQRSKSLRKDVEELAYLILQIFLPIFICLVARNNLIKLLRKVYFILAEDQGRLKAPLELKEVLVILKEQGVPQRLEQLLENAAVLCVEIIDVRGKLWLLF